MKNQWQCKENESDEEKGWQEPDDEEDPHHASIWGGFLAGVSGEVLGIPPGGVEKGLEFT